MKLTQVLSAVVGALVLCALWALPSYAQEVQSGAEVIYETNHDTSPALADLATAAAEQPEQPAESAIILPVRRTSTTETAAGAAVSEVDAVVQQLSGPRVSATIGLNFDGLTNLDRAVPPDTNASVGATQVVETVNLHYQVFNKTTGASVLGPLAISGIWSGFNGTLCGKTSFSYSDPVVLYDKAAARWVISILAFNNRFTSSSECYAVSTTSDATGSYNRYEVPFGSNLPDYPKFAVWPDAYYATFNIFPSGGAFAGAEVCALNRAAMLAGSAMTAECFQRTTADASFLPADADGATAPAAGEPDFYVELSSQSRSLLNLFKFHSDFITPALATFTGPTTIAVAAYTQACGAGGTCIPQPGTRQKLDSLGDRLMHRLAWRNLNGVEHLVVTHSVKPGGSAAAGARWYDIVNPATAPTISQQGTVIDGVRSLWMGSIAMDKAGDFALGFSRSSSSIRPGIAFTGRVPTDPINTMEALKIITAGTASQTSNRWGDYTSMSIDPADDCTFWYANEYLTATGTNWHTRLASLKFPGCH